MSYIQFLGAACLVHGEPDSAAALQQAIEHELRWRVEIARYMQQVEIG